MGGRINDKYLDDTRETALACCLAPLPVVRTLHVDAEFLAELIEEIQQHRKALGLVNGVKP